MNIRVGDIITAEILIELNACITQVDRFEEAYPDGLELTQENFERLYRYQDERLYMIGPTECDWFIRRVLWPAHLQYWEQEDKKLMILARERNDGYLFVEQGDSYVLDPVYIKATLDNFFKLLKQQTALYD